MLADLHNNNLHSEDDLLSFAEYLGFGDIHIKVDKATGLKAIIAVHSNKLGPAIGGTRFIPYGSTDSAIRDALKLANMMSYKSAICNLPHGGGKSVIMKPAHIEDRGALFRKFGEFVEEVGGRYIAAMDSGSDVADMDEIAKSTKFVTCTSATQGDGDPSPLTALGVFRGLEASVKFKLKTDDLTDLRVAIQGVGHVGYYLGKLLHERGAKLIVCDINKEAAQRCVDEFQATVVAPDDIYDAQCDVFSPCALGGVINDTTIEKITAKIIAGAANNQLSKMSLDKVLFDRDVLYAPDFLINAGGIIHVAGVYDYGDSEKGNQQIMALYDETLKLLQRSKDENIPTNQIAIKIAEERLNG